MKRILKAIRANRLINITVRVLLKHFYQIHSRIVKQLIERWPVHGEVEIWANDISIKMICLEDEPISNHTYYFGPGVSQKIQNSIFSELALRSSAIFDIGANVGYYSILQAKANREAQIFSFEPHPSNFKRLLSNIELNNLLNVRPLNMAIGDAENPIDFHIPYDDSLSLVSSAVIQQTAHFHEKLKTIKVEQMSIDKAVKEYNVIPDFIKIDVELFERQVLTSGQKLFSTGKPIIFMEFHNIEVKLAKTNLPREDFANFNSDIQAFLAKNGYYFYGVYDFGVYKHESLVHHPALKNVLCAKVDSKLRFYKPKQLRDFFIEICS